MLLSAIKYGALSGKTRAMAGRLLKPHDYREIMLKKSVNEVAAYLKYNTHFSTVLSDLDESGIHRGHLENILKHEYIKDYVKLMRFSSGHQKAFIDLLYLKMEIESIKLLIRIFEAGHVDQSLLEESLLFLSGRNDLNIPKLALSKNLEEFLAGLKGTGYAEVMRPFVSMSQDARLFHLEMALDLYYFRKVQDASADLLHGEDRRIADELTGIEVDVFNIFWIYRIKTFYQFDSELIHTYIIPSYHRIKRTIINDLVSAKNFDEFRHILSRTPYGSFFDGKGPGAFEQRYAEFLYELHRKRFVHQPFSVACIISYLKLKEFELNNIISIIEGIRYKLSPEDIQQFVTGTGLNTSGREV